MQQVLNVFVPALVAVSLSVGVLLCVGAFVFGLGKFLSRISK